MLHVRIASTLLIAAFCATASAQVEDPRLSSVRADLRRVVAEARQDGLPAEWLEAKVAEGLVKRAPAEAIREAVLQLDARLRVAARVAGPGTSEEHRRALRALVEAQRLGFDEAAIARLSRVAAQGGRRRDVWLQSAASALAQLKEQGYSNEDVLEATVVALRRGGRAGVTELVAGARSRGRRGGGPGLRGVANMVRVQRGPPHDDGFSRGHGRGMRATP